MTEPSIPSTPEQSGEPRYEYLCRACGYRQAMTGRLESCNRCGVYGTLRTVEVLAPSGESGVPTTTTDQMKVKHDMAARIVQRVVDLEHNPCEAGDDVMHVGVKELEDILAAELADSTPPVSSPEKPDPFPPTGQEPRGCPTPGACSCPPSSSLPTDEEVESLITAHGTAVLNAAAIVNAGGPDELYERVAEARTKAKDALRNAFASLHRDLEEARKENAQLRERNLTEREKVAHWRLKHAEACAALATAERERDEARKEHFPNCPAHPDIAQCVCDQIATHTRD